MKIPLNQDTSWLAFGNHAGIIQSSLDFDYLRGKSHPSIVAVIGVQQKVCRYFFGDREILLPGYVSLTDVPEQIRSSVQLIGIMQSARRAHQSVTEAVEHLPNLAAGFIFAEGVTEKDALQIRKVAAKHDLFLVGPASVGMMVGGNYKLGAIGGTMPEQIASAGITQTGDIAVISTSGGIINEIITMIGSSGGRVGYAVAIGGERFPITKPAAVFKQALEDPSIASIVYFGELGGKDEYEIADIYAAAENKKPAFCYVAGEIAEKFDTPQQFGHAKAMAHGLSETATAKKEALSNAGLTVAKTFGDFEHYIKGTGTKKEAQSINLEPLLNRRPALFVDSVSREDDDGTVKILGENILSFIGQRSLSEIALEMFLGKKEASEELRTFFDTTLRLLVDHGPQVSGVVNTMITARAGKDLSAALATGILTVGPRFGGAINTAALNWFDAVNKQEDPNAFVERFAAQKQYIAGIGHRKYRSDNPDPRVEFLLEKFYDESFKFTSFAKKVEAITISKKAQLILNVDGAVAALLLDMLVIKESMSTQAVKSLLDSEFCNAIFILSRSNGFIAHFLEQKRLDEGLFRLPDSLIVSADN